MKRTISILRTILSIVLCICMLSAMVACKGKDNKPDDGTTQTTGETGTQATEPSGTQATEPSGTQGTEPSGTQATEPSGTQATEPKPTEPKPTEPKPTEPKPTEPKPTEPKPTEPKPTETEPAKDPNIYEHVIVIGVDGAGVFFQNVDTPNYDRIFANGATTYTAQTEYPSHSAESWASLLHGVTCEYHGVTDLNAGTYVYPRDDAFPSIFRAIREQNSKAKLGSFATWPHLNKSIVENGFSVQKGGNLNGDSLTINELLPYIKKKPDFVFLQLDCVDYAGHSKGYGSEKYQEEIKWVDEQIGRIYKAYEDAGIIDETLFIVTADHGGIGTSHGGSTEVEMTIMFAATGKTVQKGTIGEMEIRDTAAIVLHALGYEQPKTWTARVPSGLFKGVTAGERPVYNGD